MGRQRSDRRRPCEACSVAHCVLLLRECHLWRMQERFLASESVLSDHVGQIPFPCVRFQSMDSHRVGHCVCFGVVPLCVAFGSVFFFDRCRWSYRARYFEKVHRGGTGVASGARRNFTASCARIIYPGHEPPKSE